jgi:hypothetical protein
VNTGTAAVPGWTLAFRYPGDQRVLSVVGATSTQDGPSVVLTAGTPLMAGEAARVSLVGTYATGNPMPTAFALAGHPCEGQVVGAAAPPVVVGGGGAGGPDGGGPGPGAGPAPPADSDSDNSGPGSGPDSGPGHKKPGKGKKGKG